MKCATTSDPSLLFYLHQTRLHQAARLPCPPPAQVTYVPEEKLVRFSAKLFNCTPAQVRCRVLFLPSSPWWHAHERCVGTPARRAPPNTCFWSTGLLSLVARGRQHRKVFLPPSSLQLPADLKASLVNMLSCQSMEGYLRPGCVHITGERRAGSGWSVAGLCWRRIGPSIIWQCAWQVCLL